MENSILRLELGGEFQHFDGKCIRNETENLSKHEHLSKSQNGLFTTHTVTLWLSRFYI